MAHRIKVISMIRPRIKQGTTVQRPELLRAASYATGLVEGVYDLCMRELHYQIIFFLRQGRAVKVEGLGTLTPIVGLDGSFGIQYRPDNALIQALNLRGVFTGKIRNREHLGKSPDELVACWNELHPEDPVTK